MRAEHFPSSPAAGPPEAVAPPAVAAPSTKAAKVPNRTRAASRKAITGRCAKCRAAPMPGDRLTARDGVVWLLHTRGPLQQAAGKEQRIECVRFEPAGARRVHDREQPQPRPCIDKEAGAAAWLVGTPSARQGSPPSCDDANKANWPGRMMSIQSRGWRDASYTRTISDNSRPAARTSARIVRRSPPGCRGGHPP